MMRTHWPGAGCKYTRSGGGPGPAAKPGPTAATLATAVVLGSACTPVAAGSCHGREHGSEGC